MILLEPTYLPVLESTQQRKVTQMCGWIDKPAISESEQIHRCKMARHKSAFTIVQILIENYMPRRVLTKLDSRNMLHKHEILQANTLGEQN